MKIILKNFVLVFILFFIFVGVGFGQEEQEKHPIEGWLEKCIEKDSTTAGKVNCVMQTINIEININKCSEEDSTTVKKLECSIKAQRLWDKITDNKSVQKVIFGKETYRKKEYKKYVNYVWKYWVLKELNKSDIKMLRISKDNIFIIEADLNDDGFKDFIATVADNIFFCGRGGPDCSFKIFIAKPKGGFYTIESYMSVITLMPIYIVDIKKNGLKKLVINGRFILEFDGKKHFILF